MDEKKYMTGRYDPLCQGCWLSEYTPLDFKDCKKCRKLFEEHPEEFKDRKVGMNEQIKENRKWTI